jgi:transposase
MSTRNDSDSPIRYVPVDRSQLSWEMLDLEQLIPANHRARIIWEVSGTVDLSGFEEQSKSRQGSAGRPCWPPQLLISVWVYAYSIGIASARAIERLMGQDPALRWLSANQIINYHTLADFRVGHKEALEELFAQFLVLLDAEGVLDLSTILHDGTKIQAVAGRRSYHRRKTLEKRLRAARRLMQELDRRADQEPEAMEEKRAAAQRRAARESVDRIQGALKQLKKRETETPPGQHPDLRVSDSEPEARKMKQPDGGFALSYNVQVSTEAKARIIVGIGVTTAMNDTQELLPALEKVEANCGELPEKIIADNGYATRDNVEKTAEQGVQLIAPWKEETSREAGACKKNGIEPEYAPSAFQAQKDGKALICPAGKNLVLLEQRIHHGLPKNVFTASEDDCAACAFRQPCCGNRSGPRQVERVVESEAMRHYLARMNKPSTQALYKKRSEIAEFPHLWTKGVKNWRRFSVRGLVKVGMEALWVALAYNVTQWIRIRTAAPIAA